MHTWKETYLNSKPGQASYLRGRRTILVIENKTARLKRRRCLRVMVTFIVSVIAIGALMARKMAAIDKQKESPLLDHSLTFQNAPQLNLLAPR